MKIRAKVIERGFKLKKLITKGAEWDIKIHLDNRLR